jgi:hypothetical protein
MDHGFAAYRTSCSSGKFAAWSGSWETGKFADPINSAQCGLGALAREGLSHACTPVLRPSSRRAAAVMMAGGAERSAVAVGIAHSGGD